MSDRIAVFDMGQIVQIGAPSDLYERPRTRFVAGFVGTSNILSGETAVAITGSPQPFSVRPEKIRLVAVDTAVPDGHCAVEGQLRDMVYVGMHTRYTVVLPSGEEMVVVQQNMDVTPQNGTAVPGQAVRLVWPGAANNVLEIGD